LDRLRRAASVALEPEAAAFRPALTQGLAALTAAGCSKSYTMRAIVSLVRAVRVLLVLVPMALAALEQLLAWGDDAVAATIAPLVGRIAADAEALGIPVAPAHLRAGHMLGLRLPEGAGPAMAEALAADGST
jgi:hypothetical protein